MRIVIVGSTGCGKTALAQQLSEQLQIPVYDLDDFYWLPHWQPQLTDKFQQRVLELTQLDSWIISGNYSVSRDLIWSTADIIIWLDYSFRLIFWRLLKRSWQRLHSRQMICNGNYETWQRILSPRYSIIAWLFKSYWRRKREYPQLLENYKKLGKRVIIYKNTIHTGD